MAVPVAALMGAVGMAGGAAVAVGLGSDTPPDTIIEVEGDAANGFGIHYFDGSEIYPPTDSETMAECEEYDRWIRRFRCKVSNRTWFRALAGFKETTRYYRSLP